MGDLKANPRLALRQFKTTSLDSIRKNSIQGSWCNSTLLNPLTMSSFDNVNIDCFSMYFDSEFNWMGIGHRNGTCTNSLPRQEVVAYDKFL